MEVAGRKVLSSGDSQGGSSQVGGLFIGECGRDLAGRCVLSVGKYWKLMFRERKGIRIGKLVTEFLAWVVSRKFRVISSFVACPGAPGRY